MTRGKVLASLWVLLGFAGLVLTTYHLMTLAADPQYGFSSTIREPLWWFIQALFPTFFCVMVIAGFGVLFTRRWGLWAFRILAPLMLLYTLAYTIFGGERAWWLALIGLAWLAFAVVSTLFAYANRDAAT